MKLIILLIIDSLLKCIKKDSEAQDFFFGEF